MASQQKATFSYSTFTDTMLASKQAVLDQVNLIESKRDQGIPEGDLQRLRELLDTLKRDFPTDFPNRMWHILIMEGMVHSTLGEFEKAIAIDKESLDYAATDDLTSISLLNLSEDFFHSGKHDDALRAAAQAYSKNPRHKGLACNLALCLKYAAHGDEANAFTEIFLQNFDASDFRDIFTLYASRDERMKEMLAEFQSEEKSEDA